jgi:hypothetical protein
VFMGDELNTAFPCVMSNLPAEIEYTILTDALNSCCSSGQRCWEMSGYKSYFITSVMIINLFYSEIVYMNILHRKNLL